MASPWCPDLEALPNYRVSMDAPHIKSTTDATAQVRVPKKLVNHFTCNVQDTFLKSTLEL
jgi:hypothetical protein